MKYAQRDEQGRVVGLFANRQPGFAEEEVADDAPLYVPQEVIDAQADREQIKAILGDLQNGVGTQAVRTTRCERVLVRLIKDLYGS